ncbi:MAG: helix-turn-helix domain-containing protein [Tabrizicola sp.]|jgi:predicted DNA-binding transcriptional regulator AlpA|nr:helix-turn-helix domain-containing protein [Tabrizicola sp.]
MTYEEASSPPLPEWPSYMSPEVAAKYLDSSPWTLSDWRFKGKGPKYIRVGQRMVRYRKEDLDAFMEAQK